MCSKECSNKCLELNRKEHPIKLPKKFKYRLELQDQKASPLFSMPINEKEFDKFLKYNFKVRYRKLKKNKS